MTASPKGRIVFVSELKASAALNASAPAFGPSYRGFTVQGTPSPPPKTHRKHSEAFQNYKTLPQTNKEARALSAPDVAKLWLNQKDIVVWIEWETLLQVFKNHLEIESVV